MASNKEVEKIHQQGLIRIDDKLCDYKVVVVWDTEAGHEIHTKCCLDVRECVSYVEGIELGSGLDNLPTSITYYQDCSDSDEFPSIIDWLPNYDRSKEVA
tara:strand:- start:87 stop:386 length:300 start_codon:yes stop_codon:yes gene_type:complete